MTDENSETSYPGYKINNMSMKVCDKYKPVTNTIQNYNKYNIHIYVL